MLWWVYALCGMLMAVLIQGMLDPFLPVELRAGSGFAAQAGNDGLSETDEARLTAARLVLTDVGKVALGFLLGLWLMFSRKPLIPELARLSRWLQRLGGAALCLGYGVWLGAAGYILFSPGHGLPFDLRTAEALAEKEAAGHVALWRLFPVLAGAWLAALHDMPWLGRAKNRLPKRPLKEQFRRAAKTLDMMFGPVRRPGDKEGR